MMRAATFFTCLFFFFFSLFAIADALPAEPANAPVARADLAGDFDKVINVRDAAKDSNSTGTTESKTVNNNDNGRATCSSGYTYCLKTGVRCPSGGDCCSNRRCCRAG
jgi:hypothetical protein